MSINKNAQLEVSSLVLFAVNQICHCTISYIWHWCIEEATDLSVIVLSHDDLCLQKAKNVWDNHFAPLLSILFCVFVLIHFVIAILSLIGVKSVSRKKEEEEEETNEHNIRWSSYAILKRILVLSYILMIIIRLSFSILTDNDSLMMIVWYSCQVVGHNFFRDVIQFVRLQLILLSQSPTPLHFKIRNLYVVYIEKE